MRSKKLGGDQGFCRKIGVVAEREYGTAGVDELLGAEKVRAAVGLGEILDVQRLSMDMKLVTIFMNEGMSIIIYNGPIKIRVYTPYRRSIVSTSSMYRKYIAL